MSTAKDLSVLIPARNEMFLQKTIESVLAAAEADTEVIAVADGAWPHPPVVDHPRVVLVHHAVSIGQRAATNEAARISRAKYVMKLDAHCTLDQGFDRKLMQAYEAGELAPDVTTIPAMYNLHGFDWECTACQARVYQGPKPAKCGKCGHRDQRMAVVWQPRRNRLTTAWRFDKSLHFQYWREGEQRQRGELCEVMCCLGACFFMPRERYWEIGGMDEEHGSWGQMGVEVGCKSWLSGGRMVVNKRTWYSHMFRTQQGFGFPYPNPGKQVEQARQHSRELWVGGKWPRAARGLDWLIEHFKPLPEWHDPPAAPGNVGAASCRDIKKGLVYYTDNLLDERIMAACQARLNRYRNGWDLVSVSLRPMEFGRNIHLALERGHLAMFRQILAGLEAVDADVVYLVEHDMLYHESHFEFVPPREDVYYYNENTWKVDAESGQALFYYCKQTSGLVAWRALLVEHYRRRVAKVEAEGYDRNMGYEPGTHRPPRGVDDHRAERFMSRHPNIDIRHGSNWTRNRWRQDQFRNKNACLGWQMADEVPGWGRTKGRFEDFLKEALP
jgi:hypothetical protein